MKNTLQRLLKLRELSHRNAQKELSAAEHERLRHEQRMNEHQDKLEQARVGLQYGCAADMARYHTFVVRMEMQRRTKARSLRRAQQEEDRKRGSLKLAAREAKTVELMLEKRVAVEAEEERRTEGRRLDELAMLRWKKAA